MLANPPQVIAVPGVGAVIRVDDLVDWLADEAADQRRVLRGQGSTPVSAPEEFAYADAWEELADELEGLIS